MCAVSRRPLFKKNLHLKRIASDTVVNTQNGINVRDIIQLVKTNLPALNPPPSVIEKNKLLKTTEKTVILKPGK